MYCNYLCFGGLDGIEKASTLEALMEKELSSMVLGLNVTLM